MTSFTRTTPARAYALGALVTALATACASGTDPVQPLSPSSEVVAARAADLTHPAGTLDSRLTSFSGRPFGIDVSPKGLTFVTEQDVNAVARFTLDAPTTALASVPVTADPGDVIFNHSGSVAYVSTYFGGKVHVINANNGAEKSSITIGSNAYRLALSGDESRLFVTTSFGSLYAVPTHGAAAPTFVALGGALQGIAVSKATDALFVTSPAGTIWRLDPSTLAVQASVSGLGSLQDVAVSPDGAELYVANEWGSVLVVKASTLATAATIPIGSGAFGLAISPDGVQLYATSPGAGLLTIIDRAQRTIVSQTYVGGTPRRVAFDAKGTTAVIANEGNWVDVVK